MQGSRRTVHSSFKPDVETQVNRAHRYLVVILRVINDVLCLPVGHRCSAADETLCEGCAEHLDVRGHFPQHAECKPLLPAPANQQKVIPVRQRGVRFSPRVVVLVFVQRIQRAGCWMSGDGLAVMLTVYQRLSLQMTARCLDLVKDQVTERQSGTATV